MEAELGIRRDLEALPVIRIYRRREFVWSHTGWVPTDYKKLKQAIVRQGGQLLPLGRNRRPIPEVPVESGCAPPPMGHLIGRQGDANSEPPQEAEPAAEGKKER